MTAITIPKKIEQELKYASRNLGLSEKDFLVNAILYYLQTLEKRVELKKELKAWEKASDFDLIKFEKNL